MQIISFAWTIDALLALRKSVTRRDWPDSYAKLFRPGDLVQGYDKGARSGGKRRAIIRLQSIYREPLSRLREDAAYAHEELIKEGDLWASLDEFLTLFGVLRHGDPYRLEFAVTEIEGKQMILPMADPVPAIHAEFCKITGQQIKLSMVQPLWKELVLVHGCTAADVALTARYLVREVTATRRQGGCLKIHNFASPVNFAGDLGLAQRAEPKQRPAKRLEPDLAVAPPATSPDQVRQNRDALKAIRLSLRGGKTEA